MQDLKCSQGHKEEIPELILANDDIQLNSRAFDLQSLP